jgi:hypothetical protein
VQPLALEIHLLAVTIIYGRPIRSGVVNALVVRRTELCIGIIRIVVPIHKVEVIDLRRKEVIVAVEAFCV